MAVPSRPRVGGGEWYHREQAPIGEPPPPADGSESHPYHALPGH